MVFPGSGAAKRPGSTTSTAMHVGRVGALAVALGVGIAIGPIAIAMPTPMISRVMPSSGHAARLWMKGILRVRIMCTISVCESRPSTNQPDWNSV